MRRVGRGVFESGFGRVFAPRGHYGYQVLLGLYVLPVVLELVGLGSLGVVR